MAETELLQAVVPEQSADLRELLELADEFARAADRLLEMRLRRKPLSQAPFRFTAIHAIELYLNAVLRSQGTDEKEVRGLQHNLSKRLALTEVAGLTLKKRTAAHIEALKETQEYVKARYTPKLAANLSQLNRLQQTLKEVQEKARAIVERAEASAAVRKNSAGSG